MAITAGGVGSGLDVNGIVSQLMLLEREPLNKLEATGKEYEAQLSAYGRLRGAVSSFQSAMGALGTLDKFKVFSSNSSNDDILTATSDSNAAAGIYNIDVTRLAQNHKMGSNQIADTDTFSGSLALTVDGDTLNIDTTGLTLSGIRDAINSDANNPGLTATILNFGGGNQRLILTADEPGTAKSISLNEAGVTNTSGGAALGLMTNNRDENDALITTAELDAAYTIDGYALTSASNTITGTIDGISLHLKGLGSSTITLERDTQKIEESVKEFVGAYNELHAMLTSFSEKELSGDSTVRSIQSQLRNVLNTAPVGLTGTFTMLSEIGITSDAKSGELSFDTSRLSNSLDTDYQSVAELFAHDNQGFAFRFESIADTMLDENNVIDARESGLRDRIDDVEDRVVDWEVRLEYKEIALRAKFASLDALIGSMQSTSSFLMQLG